MHHVPKDHQLRAESGSQARRSVSDGSRRADPPYLLGLRIPDPQFPSRGPADRRPRPPAPRPALDGQRPQPSAALNRPSVEQLRWARCPDQGRLHLVQPADVTRAAASGYTQTVCGHRIAAEGLTISGVPSGELCMSCVIAATS